MKLLLVQHQFPFAGNLSPREVSRKIRNKEISRRREFGREGSCPANARPECWFRRAIGVNILQRDFDGEPGALHE
jgi:hypothetical protein